MSFSVIDRVQRIASSVEKGIMVVQFKILLLTALASICIPSSFGLVSDTPEVAQVITLNDVTSQGLIHLPSHVKKEENQLCNYWITFLNDMSDDVREYHKNFGISVVALDSDLQSDDSIFLMAHPVDGNGTIPEFENVTWDSSMNSEKLEFKPIFQDVCISLKGDWESSEATLLVTMFFDTSNTGTEECPDGMSKCQCSGSTRCILPDLNCNGVSNCGIDCQFDESELASCPAPKLPEGTRLLSLNEMTPQGVLSLPPTHPKLEDDVLCHYWISFLRDMPVASRQFHKKFGISIRAVDYDLKPEDSIYLLAHPIDTNETSPHFETVTWDSSTNAAQLDFEPLYMDVCIKLKGSWESSKTTLAVTFFYDNSNTGDKTEEEEKEACPAGMVQCQCSESTRCISEELICNGVANCGIDCQFDESEFASCPAPKLPEGTRLVPLNEMTPQGVLNLPPSHPALEDGVLCHYWVSFLRDLPADARVHHKNFGISVRAMNYDLKPEDSIYLLAHPIDTNETSPHFETVTWDSSTSAAQLEFKSLYTDVCIKLKGSWESSKTTLAVTFFFDNTNMNEEDCPSGMAKCKCSSGSRRCISENLLCNGVDNCDINCEFDETELASCPAPELPEGMKVIVLDEVTPQGLLNLPPSHPELDEGQLCHYWISFLKNIPASVREHHKNFGISVRALNVALKPEDSIFLMGHPVDGNNTIPEFETVTWDSSSNSNSPQLEFKPMFQDVCIKLKGGWTRSEATLVMTLFYDNTEMTEDYCPEGMTLCKCSGSRRCIYEELLCNGVGNCGSDCQFDETENASCKNLEVSHSSGSGSCTWANFEYLLMMVMTGLLLILIPAVFLLTFMYHKRANMARSFPASSDGNNNANRNNGHYPHVITMSPPNDTPPRYDELPEGVKVESRGGQQHLHS